MKFRSFVLVACLVVVPALAMFSHHVPPAARVAAGEFVQKLAAALGRSSPAAPAPSPARPADPAAGSGVQALEPVAPQAAVSPTPVAPAVVPVVDMAPRDDSLSRLRSLGAVAVDCRPLEGRGGHVASCRLPVDAAGQLQRVFQATGPDAAAAGDRLLSDVLAWQSGQTRSQPGTMRF